VLQIKWSSFLSRICDRLSLTGFGVRLNTRR
jgi:hypothetical protein